MKTHKLQQKPGPPITVCGRHLDWFHVAISDEPSCKSCRGENTRNRSKHTWIGPFDEWPEGVSDGLVLPCGICGHVPEFDYTVTEKLWERVVPGGLRLGVICLPCLSFLAEGLGEKIGGDIVTVQWVGAGETVELRPRRIWAYYQSLHVPGHGTDHE